MNTQEIYVSDVKIRTSVVEIQTLKIHKKQMTLSTFRQLNHRKIIDEKTGLLNGTIWGYVNYFWGNNNSRNIRHILWETEGRLFRSLTSTNFVDYHSIRTKEKELETSLNYIKINKLISKGVKDITKIHLSSKYHVVFNDEQTLNIKFDSDFNDLIDSFSFSIKNKKEDQVDIADDIASMLQGISGAYCYDIFGTQEGEDYLREDYEYEKSKYNEFKTNLDKSITKVNTCEQIFIAT